MNSQRHLLVGLAGFAMAVAANLASAITPEYSDTRSVVVRYSDLDLTQPQDAHRLYVRIERAARSICGNRPTVELMEIAAYKRCINAAVADGVAKVRAIQPSAHLYAQFGH